MKYTVVVMLLLGAISHAQAVKLGSQGFPVYVNPESVLYPNTEAATSLAFSGFQVGLDELNLVQTKTEGFPVYVNPESVLYPNT